MTTCEQAREWASASIDGELEEQQSPQGRHLRTCASCGEYLRELGAASRPIALPEVRPDPWFVTRVTARLGGEHRALPALSWRLAALRLVPWAIGLSLLAAGLIWLDLRQHEGRRLLEADRRPLEAGVLAAAGPRWRGAPGRLVEPVLLEPLIAYARSGNSFNSGGSSVVRASFTANPPQRSLSPAATRLGDPSGRTAAPVEVAPRNQP